MLPPPTVLLGKVVSGGGSDHAEGAAGTGRSAFAGYVRECVACDQKRLRHAAMTPIVPPIREMTANRMLLHSPWSSVVCPTEKATSNALPLS